jgi:hypothetical protein
MWCDKNANLTLTDGAKLAINIQIDPFQIHDKVMKKKKKKISNKFFKRRVGSMIDLRFTLNNN